MARAGTSDDDASSRDLGRRVGARIRRLRQDRSVSLSDLARASGLGKGTLSELENGRRNPTLDTLFAITTVLDAPLSALLADDEEGPADEATGNGVRARLLHRHSSASERFDLFVLHLDERAHVSEPHHAGVRETLTVLEGRLRAGPVEDLADVGSGETLTYPGDAAHSYQSVSPSAVALLLMRYPAADQGS